MTLIGDAQMMERKVATPIPAPASSAAARVGAGAPEPSDAERWQAVLERNPCADGAFVYAVRSTGVYCRPICPSRRPRRSRVAFYASPEAAAAAGFRACRRCRPDARPYDEIERVRMVCRRIEAGLAPAPTLAGLAREAGCGAHTLWRSFKRLLGVTPAEYAAACRRAHFKALLRDGADLATATYTAGYGSSSRLYERADEMLGMTPGAYRRGGAGQRIRYTIGDGFLLAAGERGFCALYLGEEPARLRAALEAEYPAAAIVRDAAALARWRGIVHRHLEGETTLLELPLDISATAFQIRVWRALRQIPPGETRTYGEIAQAIGAPTAARAVGAACGRNPVSVVVPCHRAVGAGGGLTGYRWGLAAKRRLLAIERAHRDPAHPPACREITAGRPAADSIGKPPG
jgi:AraC family transcriptional regulator of adaptative response/methylated-DNA-[protein]-cysteine methyltransferase